MLSTALRGAKHPCVLSSFGKDSLATIDLAARQGVRRVLYLEDRDEIVDEAHIARTVARYRLDVTRLPSGRALLYFIRNQPLLLGLVHVNRTTLTPIPTNVDPYVEGEPYTCVDDRLRATLGPQLDYDADVIIAGFKRADWDSNTCRVVVDSMNEADRAAYLARYTHIMPVAPGVRMVYPLLDWTHDDVWDYLARRRIEASSLMYDGRTKRPHQNPVCYRCHDPRLPRLVECPKLGTLITNLGDVQAPDSLLQLARLGIITEATARELT